jgi:agmatine deiminase
MTKPLILFLLGLFLICVPVVASELENNTPELPIGLTAEEMTRLHEIGKNFKPTAPPPGVEHACAEWEPNRGVLIRYPLGIPVAVVKEMAEDCIVYTVCTAAQKPSAISAYTSGGVNMANCEWITAATDTYWTRDYGPWYIFDGLGNVGIVDHTYNRPRPNDDVIPATLGAYLGQSVYALPLSHTGGNHMCDGVGTSMSSKLVYEENSSLTPAQVDAYMLQYLGNDYVVWDKVETTGIHHIDCWAKFLDPGTILVKKVAPGDAFYANYNARADSMSHLMSAYGKPYNVIRVYCPSGTAYTNSLILNKKVLVPTFSTTWDDTALAIYRAAMPGYEVLGFTGSWLSDDAIHCRAMGVADPKAIYITHVPLQNTTDTSNDYPVSVRLIAHSRGQFISDSLKIYYQVNGGAFQSAPYYATADPDSFFGYIPHQTGASTIRYYIKAADDSGKVITHPFIGEPMSHQFQVTVNMQPLLSDTNMMLREGAALGFYPHFSDLDDSVHTITYPHRPSWTIIRHDSLIGTVPAGYQVDSITVAVADPHVSVSETVSVVSYSCGDADGNGTIDISDAVNLIGYIFSGGVAPVPLISADADCNGAVDISDAVYLIAYIFTGGSAPCAACAK